MFSASSQMPLLELATGGVGLQTPALPQVGIDPEPPQLFEEAHGPIAAGASER